MNELPSSQLREESWMRELRELNSLCKGIEENLDTSRNRPFKIASYLGSILVSSLVITEALNNRAVPLEVHLAHEAIALCPLAAVRLIDGITFYFVRKELRNVLSRQRTLEKDGYAHEVQELLLGFSEKLRKELQKIESANPNSSESPPPPQ